VLKTIVSWSSGKDSAWMMQVLRARADVEVGGLVTTINEAAQRVAMHAVRVALLDAQAAALALPVWTVPLPSPCSNEAYEQAMRGVVERAVAEGFTHMAFADLFLEDIRRYREERLAGSGLTPLFPLFGVNTTALAREMLAAGLRARPHLRGSAGAGSAIRGTRVRRGTARRPAPVGGPVRRAGRISHVCVRRADVPTPDRH
jgi:diphthamide synthase (EF-2-diphthine--ammonia ligase)